MTTLDPHELANMPGAGRAGKALREAGLWKPTEAELPRWTVHVALQCNVEQSIDVAATDEATARKLIHEFDKWETDGEVEDVLILSVSPDPDKFGAALIVEGID